MITVEALAQELNRLDALFPDIQWAPEALATILLPFIERHIAAGQQGVDIEQIASECGAVIGYTGPGGELAEAAFSRKGLHEFARRLAAGKQGAECAGPHERKLEELIEEYWTLAYNEGKEGRDHDTENGDAQRVLHEIHVRIRALATPQPAKPAAYDIELIANMLESMNTTGPYTRTAINEQIEHLRAAENADASGVHTASKPAGAVPLPERFRYAPSVPGGVLPSPNGDWALYDDAIRYGDAREAAAGGVPEAWSEDVQTVVEWIFRTIGRIENVQLLTDDVVKATRRLESKLAALPQQPAAEGLDAGLCSDCPPDGYPTDETRCLPCPRRPLQLAAVNQQMTTQGEDVSAKLDITITFDDGEVATIAAYGPARDMCRLEARLAYWRGLESEPAGREAVAVVHHVAPVVLGADATQIAVFSMVLPPGTKLYIHPSPVADAEALKIARKTGVFYADGKVNLGAPLYAFTPTELATLARRLTGGQTDA